jgi:serine/threonine-protein kinase
VVNALEKITRAGLNLKVTSLEYDDERPRNTIIRQLPNGGSVIRQGRDVHVVISRGPREFDMPDLRDLSLRQATNLVQEKGISLAAVVKAHTDKFEPGRVVAQFPPGGAHISDMGQVRLLVSMGKAPKISLMPEFVGMSPSQAKKEIAKAGFVIGKTVVEGHPEVVPNTVFLQNPPQGMPTVEGTEVDLTVAKGSGGETPATFALYRFTLPSNAGQAAVKVVREGKDGKKQEIYNRWHNGGEAISLMVEVNGPTLVRVYLNERLTEQKQF